MKSQFAIALLLAAVLSGCGSKSNEPQTTAKTTEAEAEGKSKGGGVMTFNPEENPEKPAPAGGTKLADLKGLRLTVKNKAMINDMILAGSGIWIQNGKLFNETAQLNPGSAFCFLSATGALGTVKNGDNLVFGEPRVKEKTATAYVGDGKATLGCGKIAVDFSWSTLDLTSAFGEAAAITPL